MGIIPVYFHSRLILQIIEKTKENLRPCLKFYFDRREQATNYNSIIILLSSKYIRVNGKNVLARRSKETAENLFVHMCLYAYIYTCSVGAISYETKPNKNR